MIPSAPMDEIATGCRWAEGPVWLADHGCLLFSDIPNERILRRSPGAGTTVFRQPSHFANGHTRDRQGRLASCEHGTRPVTRTEPDGTITVLADRYDGLRLNSPNDVGVSSDGAIWFTDPTDGLRSNDEGFRADPGQDARHVVRIDPIERLLYVAESGSRHDPSVPAVIRRLAVTGQALSRGEILAAIDAGLPDGIRCQTAGNLWSSAEDGVHVFAPDGTLLGTVRVANLTFGGPRRNRLYIAATTAVYQVYVAATGAQVP